MTGLFVPRKGRAMEKGLCYGALGVSALVFLLFLLDLLVKFPFGRAVAAADIIAILASGIVAYLAYNASRDLK